MMLYSCTHMATVGVKELRKTSFNTLSYAISRRPRRTWLRTLEADLQPLNLGLNSAWKYTQDQEYWKHLVETAMFQLGACL